MMKKNVRGRELYRYRERCAVMQADREAFFVIDLPADTTVREIEQLWLKSTDQPLQYRPRLEDWEEAKDWIAESEGYHTWHKDPKNDGMMLLKMRPVLHLCHWKDLVMWIEERYERGDDFV